MPKNALTSLEVRKLIVKLRNEDKHSIGEIVNIVKKSKSVIHGILKKFEETRSCAAKKSPGRARKTNAKTNLPKLFWGFATYTQVAKHTKKFCAPPNL